jgi:EF hand
MRHELDSSAFRMRDGLRVKPLTRLLGRVALCSLVFAMSASSVLHAQTASRGQRAQKPGQTDTMQDGPPIWDYNHDGIYTCDEWKRYMDQLFTLADRNRDGFLDKSEFPTIRRAEHTLADADLDYFDDNQDGKVSRSEFVGKPSLFITQNDKNGDCRVTPDELKSGAPAAPSSALPTGRHGGGGGGGQGGGQSGFSPQF